MRSPSPDEGPRRAAGSAAAPPAADAELFRAAFDLSPDALLVIDGSGRCVAANQAAADLLGAPLERWLGAPAGEFPAAGGEVSFVRPDGASRVAEVAAVALGDGRVLSVLRDVTDRRHAEARQRERVARLDAASRAKDQFLAVLSHELRTPLTPILTLAQLIERAPDLPPAVRHAAATISRNVQLEAQLIDDLLDLTRITRGQMELSSAPVDAEDQLRQVVEMCAAEVQAKGLTVEVSCGAAQRVVRGDAARLQQVFWNLYCNAIKFTPAGGRITVRTRNTAAGVFEARFADSGIGIAPADLPRLFDPFEQGARERTRHLGGLGLGLAISRMLVDLHGGGLTAESPGVDLGATFTVTLPTEVAAAAPGGPAGPEAVPAAPRPRLLVVEDHEDTLRTMEMLLRLKGYDVVGAATVEQALRAAEDGGRIDALVSDIGLPDGSGLDLMRRLGAARPLPGIALSGFGTPEDKERCRAAGFAEHLTKPVDVDRLAEALARLLPRP